MMCVSAALLVGLFLVVSPGLSLPEKDIPNVEPEYLDMLLETKQYDLFSKLMKIDDVNLVRPSEKERSTNPMFNEGLELGDILISKKQKEEARQVIDFDKFKVMKWQNNVVPYEISTKYTTTQKNKIEDGIKRWNELLSPCIKFVPRSSQSDYVFIFSGDGCFSNLGRTGGQQPLSLAPVCLPRGTVIHEMAHAAGFTHEHSRLDRDNYIVMKWDNIPERWRSEYQINNDRQFIDILSYDYYSVMHYPVPSPETNKPAFAVRQGGIKESKIGTGDDFTPTDIEKIKSQYC